MRLLIFLIILLTACAIPSEPETAIKREEIQEEVIEPEPTPEPPKEEPLSLSLTADKTSAELKLESNLDCLAKGGTKPYKYSWKSGSINTDNCSEKECQIILNKIGEYKISCEVQDSENNKRLKSIDFKVIKEQRKIKSTIFFGDSLTMGWGLENPEEQNWGSLYTNKFEDATAFNYAIDGATSWSVKDYQYNLFMNDSIKGEKLIFVWVGANDIARFIPTQDFEKNYEEIVDKLSKIANSELILITIPDASKLPVTEVVEENINTLIQMLGGEKDLPIRSIGKDVIAVYNQVIYRIAKEHGLPIIDLSTHLEEFDESLITPDQFHPNKEGHKEIAKKVSEEMPKLFPEVNFY